ncbi:SDR family NAD(P)-dependent oxidoreductase [Paraburkholderia tuberum]|uniref:SDR family NAD(P)-dependent oxidoreductase n=1 Tax=Paraburkholderia TaxID=1822464 RepID=UPI00036464B4|nr:SDR family NAD(P)-dependent oxidoreductase [Paraburkholderia tuberum]
MSKSLVIITGASSGIGEATAHLLSQLGYPLLLLARRLERLDSLELPNTTITTNDAIKAGFKMWKESIGGVILQPEEVAEAIRFAYEMPQNVCIREIMLAATNQPV